MTSIFYLMYLIVVSILANKHLIQNPSTNAMEKISIYFKMLINIVPINVEREENPIQAALMVVKIVMKIIAKNKIVLSTSLIKIPTYYVTKRASQLYQFPLLVRLPMPWRRS